MLTQGYDIFRSVLTTVCFITTVLTACHSIASPCFWYAWTKRIAIFMIFMNATPFEAHKLFFAAFYVG